MPNNLANATKPMDTTGLTLVTPTAPSSAVSNPSADPEFSPISLAPIPPVMGTDVDAARQFYRTSVSQLRMPPIPPAGKIAQGAQAATQVIFQVNGGGPTTAASSSTGIDLQVNNVDNPSQSILNLTGPGVSYGPSKGQVSIFATIGEVQNNGVTVPGEPILNFLSPLVVSDNPGNTSSDISISLATLFYQTVQQAGTSKPQEPKLNFLAPMTVTDDPGNVSSDVAVSVMVGDSGSGGVAGLVPTPPAGSFAAGKFLNAGGGYSIPPGTGGTPFYQTIQQAGVSKPQESVLNFLFPFLATDNPGNTSTDITASFPGIDAFTNKNLAGTVALTAGVGATVDSISVTFPAAGGPFYARVNYYYSVSGGVDFIAAAFDGAVRFAGCQGTVHSSISGASASSLSPTTYANGATVTFSVVMLNTGNATVETSGAGVGIGVDSYMQVEVIRSS